VNYYFLYFCLTNSYSLVKKILLAVLIIALISVCTGIYMWNKPHPEAKHGIPVTAINLSKEFNADEKKANAAYLDKVLEVSGTISDISKNQDGDIVVTLDTGDPMSGVLCTMKDKSVNPAKGQTITVVGFCRGNNLGVVLNDCIIK
jgi:hypothetical protein